MSEPARANLAEANRAYAIIMAALDKFEPTNPVLLVYTIYANRIPGFIAWLGGATNYTITKGATRENFLRVEIAGRVEGLTISFSALPEPVIQYLGDIYP